MDKFDFTVVEHSEAITIFGLSKHSNDKTQANDIPILSKTYYEIVGKNNGEVIPFFVISKDYDINTKDFLLLIGSQIENSKLEPFVIPKGFYGKITIKPKLGLMWGLSIGEAKRTFYTQWLPKMDYLPLNMEYEYHTEMSMGRKPQLDIFFAIKKR